MGTGEIERAACVAAYRVLTANTTARELACASARRSHAIDMVAAIIKDTFESLQVGSEAAPLRSERVAGRPNGVLVEIPQRPLNRCDEPRVADAGM